MRHIKVGRKQFFHFQGDNSALLKKMNEQKRQKIIRNITLRSVLKVAKKFSALKKNLRRLLSREV